MWLPPPDTVWIPSRGGPGHPAWRAHDPMLHLEQLRGKALYLSAGSGVPGPHEMLNARGIDGDPLALADRQIPATVHFHPGTHAWAYWQDDLHRSWPVFAGALGV